MSAVKDKLVNVPVDSSDVINTIRNIPRTPKEAGLVQVKLKRRLKYKNHHSHEFISPDKIFKMLEFLKKSRHPYYQFYDDPRSYKKRWMEQLVTKGVGKKIKLHFIEDTKIPKIVELNKENRIIAPRSYNDLTDDEEEDLKDEAQYIENDPVKKMQFDHNVSTCLTNKFPEMLLDDDGKEILSEEDFSFAPAEGKTPKNFLSQKDWDIKAWPSVHPDGNFGLHHKRKINLTDQKYFVHRIRNKDRRFEGNPGYVFAAASYIEKKKLQSNANISFCRGKKTSTNDGMEYTLDDPFTVFDNLKNTPKYWQKYKYEMIAKLENLGPFQWFFTLSCADRMWNENFSSLLEDIKDIKLEYEVLPNGISRTTVKFIEDGNEETMELQQYLEEKVDESQHEMIRTNLLNATRNFQHRVREGFKKKKKINGKFH